jgi:hypothetical protein
MRLYEITDNYKALLDLDIDEQTLADTLESIEGEFEDKADAICHVIANLDADIEALDSEAKRLQARKNTFSNRKDSLKSYLRSHMELIDKKKIETAKFTINCVAGRDMVGEVDYSKLPARFMYLPEVEEKLDSKMLLEALKAGNVQGAKLGKTKSSLRIK